MSKSKISEAARALSKLGAKKGGHARAEALTDDERRESARKAAGARWAHLGPDHLTANQKAILAKLKGPETVRINVRGRSGFRKQRAIAGLEKRGMVRVLVGTLDVVSICAP